MTPMCRGLAALIACTLAFSAVGTSRVMAQESGQDTAEPILNHMRDLKAAGRSDEIPAYWNSLSADDQAAVERASRTATVKARSSGPGSVVGRPPDAVHATSRRGAMTSAYAGCWYENHTVNGYNVFGGELWYFTQEMEWCGDGPGTSVYGYWSDSYGSGEAPGWEYDGVIASAQWWGEGWTAVRFFSQGSFGLCFAWCIEHQYPAIWEQGSDDGSYAAWDNS